MRPLTKRCAPILLLTLFLSTTCGEVDDFGGKLLEFHQVYNSFFRKYFGCPDTATDVEDCIQSKGILDYKLLNQVRRKAEMFKQE